MPQSSGAQKRTIICSCGKHLIGPPNRLDTISRLHSKVCPMGVKGEKPSTIAFDKTNVCMGGLTRTKHGAIAVKNDNIMSRGFAEGEFINNMLIDRPDFTGEKGSKQLFDEFVNKKIGK